MTSKINTSITAVGKYLPPHILSNSEIEKRVNSNDEWITVRTGIKERRILADKNKATSDMAIEAIKEILAKKEISADDIDCIIVATITPDYRIPATANIVCDKLGARNAWGFDVNSACSGFMHALSIGDGYIKNGRCKKVIVVGADKMSSIVNPNDRNTVVIFGDGAGAVLLEPTTENVGIQDFVFKSEGKGAAYLQIKAGGSRHSVVDEKIVAEDHYLQQEGRAIFKSAVTNMCLISKEILSRNNLSVESIDHFVPHQANLRIIESVARQLGMPMNKVLVNIEKYGNTTAATIPLCLWDLEKKCQKEDLVLLTAFGAGFSWGSILLKWAY